MAYGMSLWVLGTTLLCTQCFLVERIKWLGIGLMGVILCWGIPIIFNKLPGKTSCKVCSDIVHLDKKKYVEGKSGKIVVKCACYVILFLHIVCRGPVYSIKHI